MWLILTFLMLIFTLLIYGITMRLIKKPSPIFGFLFIGSITGLLHIILLLFFFGLSAATFAGILVYAMLSEFMLEILSVTMNSVSISVLDQLSEKPITQKDLDEKYSTYAMVTRRIQQLKIDAFIEEEQEQLKLTKKGERLLRIFLKCHQFFFKQNKLKIKNKSSSPRRLA